MIDGGGTGAMLGAAAITGFAVWELQRSYTGVAPTLAELRDASNDATLWRQRLLDADICTGGLAALAGVSASLLSQSWIPVLVIGAAMVWISYYHHAVLDGMTPVQIDRS